MRGWGEVVEQGRVIMAASRFQGKGRAPRALLPIAGRPSTLATDATRPPPQNELDGGYGQEEKGGGQVAKGRGPLGWWGLA